MNPTIAYTMRVDREVPKLDQLLTNPHLPMETMLYYTLLLMLTKHDPAREYNRASEIVDYLMDEIWDSNSNQSDNYSVSDYEYYRNVADRLGEACARCFEILFPYLDIIIPHNVFDYYVLDRIFLNRGQLVVLFRIGKPL